MTETMGPLKGLRILDISSIIAAPLAATLLADFGAEVVKVEMPKTGDALRSLPPHKEGVGLWWKVTGRNKKGITLDLRTERGQMILRRLVPKFDVLVENFRPDTLEGWGIGPEILHELNPGLTILRMTAFGQTGPYRRKPGFARISEAMSGFTYLCGDPDRPPVHLGFPIADSVAGLFGAVGILTALHHQLKNPGTPGQVIDLSLYESMFRMLDFLPIEYDQLGRIRERSGNRSQYSGPSNVYRTRDGEWASIAATTQNIFVRLCQAMGRPELVVDDRFHTNPKRVENREALDAIVGEWVGSLTMAELHEILDKAEVGFSPIYHIGHIFEDPHYKARKNIIQVDDPELGPIRMQNVVPLLSATPGTVQRAAPMLGEHNEEIYGELLGMTRDEIRALQVDGVM